MSSGDSKEDSNDTPDTPAGLSNIFSRIGVSGGSSGEPTGRSQLPNISNLHTGEPSNSSQRYDTHSFERYNMSHEQRGEAIIFSFEKFEPVLELSRRTGTHTDATNLYHAFNRLGFHCVIKTNFTKNDVLSKIKELSVEEDHSKRDCFVLCFLTHGEDNGVLFVRDGSINVNDLVEPFEAHKCKTLQGKPKLFFIQACRGRKLQEGVEIIEVIDAAKAQEGDDKLMVPPDLARKVTIPVHADFLIGYSTIPGYYSWRNTQDGSWFIQALCNILNVHANGDKEIMQLCTKINHKVGYDFESRASALAWRGKRQISCFNTMLTKELYLKPKTNS